MWRFGARLVAFALAFAATGQALVSALDGAGVGSRRTRVDSVVRLASAVRLLELGRRAERSLAMVGDSHLMIGGQGGALHAGLERALRARGEDVRVSRVADNGLSLLGQYCLADALAAARPDEVVLALNLAHLSPGWQTQQLVPCLVLLEPRRWVEAALLPLHRDGVSLDRLLFYGALGQGRGLGLLTRLTRQQARVVLAWTLLVDAVQTRSPWPGGLGYVDGLERRELERVRDDRGRATAAWAHALYGTALEGVDAGHASLRVLEALLRHYRQAGVPVLVFVNPMNVVHLRALGLVPAEGLAETLRSAEAVVRGQGARWLDLHDRFGDADFVDPMDHLGRETQARARLAERLAEMLVRGRPGPARD
ncbi:MAG: hypothetical protein QNK04_21135 [Myxococcota bacterium]|nr:hypothetical protein [Myxococcota bacterium]